MSLWYKRIDQITFEDVEDFCQLKLREGPRLDYKSQFPNHLERLISAFANSQGGLIIFGVDSDRTTNEPIWPPQGMAQELGIEERIIQICRDGIYPPVRPLISRLLENPHRAGTLLLVVRIDESHEAPHAVDQGRHMYERTGNLNTAYDFAHIERVQHLLTRRQKFEEQREAMLQTGIKRAHNLLPRQIVAPSLRWASAIPLFPWRDLCHAQNCRDFHDNWKHQICSLRTHWDVQRVPGGSLALGTIYRKDPLLGALSTLNSKGHVFAIEYAVEQHEDYPRSVNPLDFRTTREFGISVFAFAKTIYEQGWFEKPGLVYLSLGFLNVLHRRMVYRPGPEKVFWGDKNFPDEEFRVDESVHVERLLDNPQEAAKPLFDQVAFAFDVVPPTS